MRKRINDTLLELIVGILFCGVVIQAVELIVAGFIWQFLTGLWIGAAAAVFMACHMYRSIDRALDMDSGSAEKYMRKTYAIRTAVILAVALVVAYFKLGYVVVTFVGMLCLKFGAFLQPLTHRILVKLGIVEEQAETDPEEVSVLPEQEKREESPEGTDLSE